MVPRLVSLNSTFESWGETSDDFYVSFAVDIGTEDGDGSETFSFNVISPRRLEKILQSQGIELGRGLFIMSDYNIETIRMTVNQLLSKSAKSSWNEIVYELCKYFYWEYDNYQE